MKKRVKNTERKLKKRKSLLISLAALVTVAAAIICAVVVLRQRETLILKEPVYTCVNGVKIGYPNGARVIHRKDVTYVDGGGGEQMLERYPFILEDGAILLLKSGSLNLQDDSVYRVDYYTEIRRGEDGRIRLSARGKEISVDSGFFYDNNDTYVFFEPAKITWGEESADIAPMTVVQAGYQQYLQIYGPETEPRYELTDTDVMTAEFEGGRKLNMATDRFYQKNGSWRLLFLPLEVLPEMSMGGSVDEEEE